MTEAEQQLTQMQEWAKEPLLPELERWVDYEGPIGPMLRHPICYDLLPHSMPGHTNLVYQQKRRRILEAIRNGEWDVVIHIYERPYRMEKLVWMWKRRKFDIDRMRELLASWWTDCEMPQSNQDEPLHLFREAVFTTDDQEAWDALEDPFVLYRGVDWDFELTPDGPSWTLDLDVARFFAYRLGGDKRGGSVYRYVAHKAEALAYLAGRSEAEVILDFDYCSSRDSIEILEGPGHAL